MIAYFFRSEWGLNFPCLLKKLLYAAHELPSNTLDQLRGRPGLVQAEKPEGGSMSRCEIYELEENLRA